jgi:hypothetical protein
LGAGCDARDFVEVPQPDDGVDARRNERPERGGGVRNLTTDSMLSVRGDASGNAVAVVRNALVDPLQLVRKRVELKHELKTIKSAGK